MKENTSIAIEPPRRGGSLDEQVGTGVSFSRTIGEYDVYAFAGITNDNHPNHTDEEYARANGLGGRVAQGALMVGLMAGGSTLFLGQLGRPAVSLGYDRIRFVKGVHIGDTVTLAYRVVRSDEAKRRLWSDVTLANQRGETVAVGTHILYFQ